MQQNLVECEDFRVFLILLAYHVPKFTPDEHICLRHCMAERTAMRLVLGFCASGLLCTLIDMVPKEPIAFISCEFSVAKGSAIIFTCVLAPRPAMASNAATFMFVGNPRTASTALPSKIVIHNRFRH